MKKLAIAVLIIAIVALACSALYLGFIQNPPEMEKVTSLKKFTLTSTAFHEMGRIPEKYTCDGLDLSPPLRWEGYPPETVSFVLIVEDPDAPGGTFTHWVIYNIPSTIHELQEGVPKSEELSSGALQGVNDFGRIGYNGPCPPPGKPHRYVFKVYALDSELNLEPGATRDDVLNAMKGHVLAEATLTGLYSR